MFNSEPKFILKAENNKAFDNSSLVKTLDMKSGNIAECLEQCLQNCRCQSFQICQNTKCQLCSSHKEENSSLLHDEDGCVYATYEMRQPTKTFKKLEEQCLDTSCALKYNCCQQAGFCPKNKVCKPFHSPTKPWKRFTCECRDGYHGDNCDQPIRSCAWYLDYVRGESGKYKLVDSQNAEYEVYCHFDSDGVWTLVQSYSFANGSSGSKFPNFRKLMSDDHPVGENAATWSGYRLSKSRMESIRDDSTFVQFTCDYEKVKLHDIRKSDYLQIPLQAIKNWRVDRTIDILKFSGLTSDVNISTGCGSIGGYNLTDCKIRLHQNSIEHYPLHVHVPLKNAKCAFNASCAGRDHSYFGNFNSSYGCLENEHRCVENDNSTTQIWFGTRKVTTEH